MVDVFLFAVFPYLAVAVAIAVGLYRYFCDRFTYTSRSSQFLESRTLFWGSVPWHYAILLVLAAHLAAVLFPGAWSFLLADQLRLQMLEVTGLGLGLAALFGIGALAWRRFGDPRVRVVTSSADWLLLAILLAQVATGVYIALTQRWGSAWYLHTAVPWLWSLARLDPQVQYVAMLPWLTKMHFLGVFALLAVFPFTRLVHVVTVPLAYLWRPYQLVLWQRRAPAPGEVKPSKVAATFDDHR